VSEPDPFLTRWSRRKREARAKASSRESEEVSKKAAQPPAPTAPAQLESTDPVVDPAMLPPIDSIDAATDIRAFLARGVSPELARAALRRAWLTDPAIRDFVGLADYDWDFNAPDAARGFGPLLASDDVRDLLARMVGEEQPKPPITQDDSRAAEGPASRIVANQAGAEESLVASSNSGDTPETVDVATRDTPEPVPDVEPRRRRHGSALPE
jgi:hypothetical protein